MKNYGYIIASKVIGEDNHPVGWMYKEEPTDSTDSGWRVFSGIEDDKFQDDADNFAIYDASTIIAIDSEIEQFLDCVIGTEVARDASGKLIIVK